MAIPYLGIYFLSRGDSFTATELYLSFYLYVFASYNGVCIVMFMYATQYNFWLYLILEYISCPGVILSPQLNYIWVFIYMFLHHITVYVLLCLCMLHNIIFGYTSFWNFVLYLSCAWVIPPLHHFYMCVCIHMFVNIRSMDTAICFCTSYDLLLGCDKSWEYCHVYFLYIICCSIVAILVGLHSQ